MVKQRQQRQKSRRSNRQIVVRSDPVLSAQTIKLSGVDIPRYIDAPPVMRTVRVAVSLTSGTPLAYVYYNTLALADANYYTATTNLRYTTMRVINVKAYAQVPGTSVSQQPYGLVLTDTFSGYVQRDHGVYGGRVAAVGFNFPFIIRTAIVATTSTAPLISVACDTTIAASTIYEVILDFLVQFIS